VSSAQEAPGRAREAGVLAPKDSCGSSSRPAPRIAAWSAAATLFPNPAARFGASRRLRWVTRYPARRCGRTTGIQGTGSLKVSG